MRAAGVGIVEQEGVARLEPPIARHFVDHRFDRECHGADKDRQAGSPLDERVAGLGVIQAVACVLGFRDDWVERSAVERGVHLVGHLREAAVQNGEGDRIDHAPPPAA